MSLPPFISKLQQKLQDPLPGMAAQALMSPVNHKHYMKVDDDHKVACVACLIYKGKEGWTSILIERQAIHPEDKHGGQLGFPGGKYEDSDTSLEFCALRETEEEIGISADKVKMIGQLSSLYIYVSNFLVYPFVGYLESIPELVPQPSEVKSVLHFPLERLIDPKIKKMKDLQIRNRTIKEVPYYAVGDKVLWGATAMMMSELEQVIGKL